MSKELFDDVLERLKEYQTPEYVWYSNFEQSFEHDNNGAYGLIFKVLKNSSITFADRVTNISKAQAYGTNLELVKIFLLCWPSFEENFLEELHHYRIGNIYDGNCYLNMNRLYDDRIEQNVSAVNGVVLGKTHKLNTVDILKSGPITIYNDFGQVWYKGYTENSCLYGPLYEYVRNMKTGVVIKKIVYFYYDGEQRYTNNALPEEVLFSGDEVPYVEGEELEGEDCEDSLLIKSAAKTGDK